MWSAAPDLSSNRSTWDNTSGSNRSRGLLWSGRESRVDCWIGCYYAGSACGIGSAALTRAVSALVEVVYWDRWDVWRILGTLV